MCRPLSSSGVQNRKWRIGTKIVFALSLLLFVEEDLIYAFHREERLASHRLWASVRLAGSIGTGGIGIAVIADMARDRENQKTYQ